MNKTKSILKLAISIALAFTFSCSDDKDDGGGSGLTGTSGTFMDNRDSTSYKWVKIGKQIWMAENLNYNATGSKCYRNSEANCEKYGRLYDWSMAMALPVSCNNNLCTSQISAKHKGICPNGWHIPSDADWNILMKFVNPSCTDNSTCAGAGTKLKATSGWNGSGNGTDDYGFSALPGGGSFNGNFDYIGTNGDWWSTTEPEYGSGAYLRIMHYNDELALWFVEGKHYLFSVRCVQD